MSLRLSGWAWSCGMVPIYNGGTSRCTLQLAGNFVKNTRKPAVIIQSSDIKVSISADPVSSPHSLFWAHFILSIRPPLPQALQALIQPLQGGPTPIKELHIEPEVMVV